MHLKRPSVTGSFRAALVYGSLTTFFPSSDNAILFTSLSVCPVFPHLFPVLQVPHSQRTIWISDDPLSTWQVYDAQERNFYDGVQRYLSFHRSNSKTIPYEDNNGRQIMDVLVKSELASLLPDAILHAFVRFTSYSQYKLRITGSHSVRPQFAIS